MREGGSWGMKKEIAQPSNPIHFFRSYLISSSQLWDEMRWVKEGHEVGGGEASSVLPGLVQAQLGRVDEAEEEERESIHCHCIPFHFTTFGVIMPPRTQKIARGCRIARSRCESWSANLSHFWLLWRWGGWRREWGLYTACCVFCIVGVERDGERGGGCMKLLLEISMSNCCEVTWHDMTYKIVAKLIIW